MENRKEELFQVLIEKTKELGHMVSFSEMRAEFGLSLTNDYAFYYGSFETAAREAYRIVFPKRGAKSMSKRLKEIERDRKEQILSEITHLFIKNGGEMPSDRQIKKDDFLSLEEVDTMKMQGNITEEIIRKLASQRTGKVYPSIKKKSKPQAHRTSKKSQEEKEEKPMRVGYSKEECEEKLRKACKKLGYVPTQADIQRCNLPNWPTLIKKVGPWQLWGEKFGVPYANERLERMSASFRGVKYIPPTPPVSLEPECTEGTDIPTEVALLEATSSASEPAAASEPATVSEPTPEPILGPTNKSISEQPMDGSREIPIKIILPAGVHGTITLNLEI